MKFNMPVTYKLTPIAAICAILCKHWKTLGKASLYDNQLCLQESDSVTQILQSSQTGSSLARQSIKNRTLEVQD